MHDSCMNHAMAPLADALGWPVEAVESAAAELHRERMIQVTARRALAPYMNRAYWNYVLEGERLAEAIYAARLR